MRSASRGWTRLLFTMLVSFGCAEQARGPRALFDRYLAVSNAHDLNRLEAMTAADVIWQLGPWTLHGKEKALGPHYSDLLNHTRLEARDVVVRGDTVECTLIERNDATRAYGTRREEHLNKRPRHESALQQGGSPRLRFAALSKL